jgi:16S rRNA (guanine966-N2)-methyltransferase
VRVIGGSFRGRRLHAPRGLATRPTPDRVREALFSILSSRVEGALFLDAYAGTGAVGIEALSRGARRCLFVESDAQALRALRRNLAGLEIEELAGVMGGDFAAAARRLPSAEGAFDIVFLDPPYGPGEIHRALRLCAAGELLAPSALLVAQHDARTEMPEREGRLERGRSYRYGSTRLTLYAPGGAASG